jgi:hypothetical protein
MGRQTTWHRASPGRCRLEVGRAWLIACLTRVSLFEPMNSYFDPTCWWPYYTASSARFNTLSSTGPDERPIRSTLAAAVPVWRRLPPALVCEVAYITLDLWAVDRSSLTDSVKLPLALKTPLHG